MKHSAFHKINTTMFRVFELNNMVSTNLIFSPTVEYSTHRTIYYTIYYKLPILLFTLKKNTSLSAYIGQRFHDQRHT
jgi:hypothetical protein